MHLSWSHKLFFLLNRRIGASRGFDRFILVSAKYLIFLLGLVVVLFVGWFSRYTPSEFALFLLLLLCVAAFSLSLSWVIGWLYPHRRPLVEFPEIRELFRPLSTWKAFPSDHTIIAFIFAEIPFYLLSFSARPVVVFPLLFFLVTAAVISVARVYAGVHYPRDILGGFLLATLVLWLVMRSF